MTTSSPHYSARLPETIISSLRVAIQREISTAEATLRLVRKDGVPKTAQELRRLRAEISRHYAPVIAKAMWTAVSPGLTESIASFAHRVQKSAELTQEARRYLADQINFESGDLQGVILQLTAESYAAGTVAAASETGDVLRGFEAATAAIDWNNWKPGYAAAVQQIQNAGLQQLLDDAGVGVQGMVDATVDQMGTKLADGIAAGDSMDTIAGTLEEFVNDDSGRALMIADTEANRAMSLASMDTYRQNGVSAKEWLTDGETDDECSENEDQGVISLDDDFRSGDSEPPAHPWCKCTVMPAWLDAEESDASQEDSGSEE